MIRSTRFTLMAIFLICVVTRQSDASLLRNFRLLAQGNRQLKTDDQTSPSPSPIPSANFNSGKDQNPVISPESCDLVADKCDIKEYKMTACVPFAGNGSQASYLLVLNNGENSLKLNITALPSNNTLENTEIPGHQIKKVNLPPNMIGNSFSLTVENIVCTIHTSASLPQDYYTSYLTPINGAYLLFLTALFIGGTWACCKFGKRKRHLKGIAYQELEMEHQQELNPSFTIESPEDWDKDWDDEWDEEKR